MRWLHYRQAARWIDEWTLVKAGLDFRALGYVTGRGAVPRRKVAEFLWVSRAHAECLAIRQQQDAQRRG